MARRHLLTSAGLRGRAEDRGDATFEAPSPQTGVVAPTPAVQLLARKAEQVLVDLARDGVEPITYGDLAVRLAPESGRTVPARQVAKAIDALRDHRGTWSWTPFLTAWVVDAETGVPNEDYYVTGVGDAAAVRAKTHQRIASGVYDAGTPA